MWGWPRPQSLVDSPHVIFLFVELGDSAQVQFPESVWDHSAGFWGVWRHCLPEAMQYFVGLTKQKQAGSVVLIS